MKVTVTLVNTAPYHSSDTVQARVDLNGRFTDTSQGFPCVRTRKCPVLAAPRSSDSEESARIAYVPIMPANSLRHELRAAMLDEIFESFRGKHTLSVGAYAAAWSGNASGNPDGLPATYDETLAVRTHPFLGLFGGGPRMISGRLSVENAWALTQESLNLLGLGEEAMAAATQAHRLTQVSFKRRVDPIIKADDTDAELVANANQAITEWCNKSVFEKKDAEDSERGLNSFSAHEWVIPGTTWVWRINVDRPTPAQAGLLLLALQALDGRAFGGMGNIGYGRVQIRGIEVDGKPVWANGRYVDNDSVMNYLAAWADAADAISPDDFESFATSQKEKASAADEGAEEESKPTAKRGRKQKEAA